jgi:hypothetical protein
MREHASVNAAVLIFACLIAPVRAIGDDSPLGLADLEAYRLALATSQDVPAPAVRFRDLWDRPQDYAGRAVTVEGRVARLFRQPKVGKFPPLVEAWVVSEAGDPFCLVFPQAQGQSEIGASVRFSGTFLKRIAYQGGDVARLAPLIVGPVAPSNLDLSPGAERTSWSSADWTMALGLALIAGLFLARRHLSRPLPAPRPLGPPPSFVDCEAGGGDFDETDE